MTRPIFLISALTAVAVILGAVIAAQSDIVLRLRAQPPQQAGTPTTAGLSCTPPADLPPGTYQLLAQAADSSGNTVEAPINVTVTAPEPAFTLSEEIITDEETITPETTDESVSAPAPDLPPPAETDQLPLAPAAPIPAACADGQDNDGDGLADSADSACHTDGNPNNPASYDPARISEGAYPAPECGNSIDDNANGLPDGADPQCHTDGNPDNSSSYKWQISSEAKPAPNQIPQCRDGKDNDEDGRIDQADSGCHSDGNPLNAASYWPDDPAEGWAVETECNDGLDNNANGLTDGGDPACQVGGGAGRGHPGGGQPPNPDKVQGPGGEKVEGGQDWKVVDGPDIDTEIDDGAEICPSPSPSASPEPRSAAQQLFRFLQTSVTPSGEVCVKESARIPEKREYIIMPVRGSDDRVGIKEPTPVNGTDARDIMETICQAKKKLPSSACSATSSACSWADIGGGNWEVEGEIRNGPTVVRHFGVWDPTYQNGHKNYWLTTVFPVAPADWRKNLPFWLVMQHWQLTNNDKELLKKADPALLTLAEQVIENAIEHESSHWRIFMQYTGVGGFSPPAGVKTYEQIINHPTVPTRVLRADPKLLSKEIVEQFKRDWDATLAAEAKAHEDFHRSIGIGTGQRKLFDMPKGYEDIDCAKDDIFVPPY